jgi:hypothetical protein
MSTPSPIERCEREIEAIRQELLRLGPMHPGSISQQYHVCGTPSCRCHHPTEPQKHGPYNKLTYVHRGRPVCRFVRERDLDELKARLGNYKTFRTLMDRWIALSIERAGTEFFPSGGKPRPDPSKEAD